MFAPKSVKQVLSVAFALACLITLLSEASPTVKNHQQSILDKWTEPSPLVTTSILLDAATVGEHVLAVGERGHVLVSKDGGRNWDQAQIPTRSTLTAVARLDEGPTWVVGHDTQILYSPNGGLQSWSRQYSAPADETPLLDVWFENTAHGLAVGAYGLILETHNGGKSWERRVSPSEENGHFYAITEGRDGSLYLAGEFGSLYRSTNRGRTWEALPSPYKGSFFGMLSLKDGALLVFGLQGNLYRSATGGLTWRPVETGTTASLMGGAQLTDGTIIIVGNGGTILVSKNGGDGFTSSIHKDRKGLMAIKEAGPGHHLIVGEGGLTQIRGNDFS